MHLRTPLLILSSLSLAALRLPAQDRSGVTIDATVGFGVGGGSEPLSNSNPAQADITIVWKALSRARGSFLLGVSGAKSITSGGDDVCVPDSSGACAQDFPRISTIAAGAGWEFGTQRALAEPSLRVLLGPAIAAVDGDNSFAAVGRIDLATPSRWRTALVVTARGSIIPDHLGKRLTLGTVGVGLRVQ